MKKIGLFTVLAMLMVALGFSTASITTAASGGLVAYWPFDEGDGTSAFDLAGGNNGTIIGASYTGGGVNAAPIAGNLDALHFAEPDQLVQVPNDTLLRPANITVTAWVRNSGTPEPYDYILAKTRDTGKGSYAFYTRNTGGLVFYASSTTAYFPSNDAGPSLWDGTWHHIAGTYDGSFIHLFVDGSEIGTPKPGPLAISYDTLFYHGDLSIGSYGNFDHTSLDTEWEGEIDEVQIYDRALSDDEIKSVMLMGSPGTLFVDEDGLVGFGFDCEGTNVSVYDEIQDAVDYANPGDTIMVCPGTYFGALVTQSVEIKGTGGATINDGPAHGSGLIQGFRLLAGSDGATISHLTFDDVDLVIMNGAAVDDVTIEHNTFLNSVQAISNWRGNGWKISHNEIIDLRTRNGGGIGILVADFSGGIVSDNVVSHNKISGTLYVDPNDGGGYAGAGIVLYADFRWGGAGAEEISNNSIVKNKIGLVSNTPDVVDVVAFELTDTRDDINADPYPVIYDNAIGFNDFRGTELQIALTPEDLEDHNDISRNLGENRGHGLHPSLFGPGGK